MNYAFPLIATLLWSVNTVIVKLSAGVISPAEIAFLRWVLAALLLLPLSARALGAHRHFLARYGWRYVLLGIVGGAVYQSLAYSAAQYTSAINLGMIQALVPLITIAITSVLLRAAPGLGTMVGATLSLVGVLVVISHGQLERMIGDGVNRGDAMMLAGVVSMAVYNVLLKRWQSELPAIASMFVQAVAAGAVLLPFYAVADRQPLTVAGAGMVLYAGTAASICAPLAWMAGLARLGPARVSIFFNLIPIGTAALATIFLGEQPTASLMVGGAMAVAGVIAVELAQKAKARSASPAGADGRATPD
ncbi:DMT family transporter [Bordetella genomosp. 13]|uniref:DMT family transporter n=1 Tax=Bordetella genomosp. 13 TaxID=463040 RepID=UPI0011AAA236|nr:DMT family transporter [Bordetella genomosp. 13]